MRIWAQIFGMDLRALAAARIAIGLLLFADLLHRLRFADVFLTADGVVPRQLFLEAYANFSFPSVHVANDSYPYQIGLLCLQMAFAIALALGYRTQTCSVVSWYLLVSLHARAPMILNSGDSLLASLLFWGIFLPWGQLWSIDARNGAVGKMEGFKVCTAATVGWVMQMVCLYLFAALHKFHPYWIEERSAVYYALSLGPHATQAASWLLPYPGLLSLLSPLVLGLELSIALLLLAPWPKIRFAVIGIAALMHLGFGLFLEIGIFRYSPLIGLIALLPWQRRREPREVARVDFSAPFTLPLLCVALLMWAMNLELLGKGRPLFLPASLVRVAPLVVGYQHWGVFAGPGLESGGWFSIEIESRKGERYEAWLGDHPFSQERPLVISQTYPDDRWRKFMLNLPSLPPSSPSLKRFAEWSLQRWKERHPDSLAGSVKVWHVVEKAKLEGGYEEPTWKLLVELKP